jgi:tetratricopeptide (TPR) repeat protein
VADQVARYMEYHWTPEAYLSTQYTYLNPSTDERGRLYQSADLQREEKRYADAAGTYRQLLAQNEGDSAAWLGLGQVQYEQRQYAAAAGSWMRAAAEPKAAPRAFYRAACAYALASQREEAIASLQKAFGAGFRNRAAIDHDPDLASIRDDPRVKKIASTAP